MTDENPSASSDSSSPRVFDQMRRAADPAIQKGRRQAGLLLDQSGNLIESASNRAADIGERFLAYTKQNPATALLLAVCAGVVLLGTLKSLESRR